MAATSPSTKEISSPKLRPSAIDYYFDVSLYLLVLAGFGTLASTGGLDLPSVTIMALAMAARGYLLASRRTLVISERWTTPLSIAYFAFFATDYFVFSRGFLPATVHLSLFAVVVRMFSVRRERDQVTLSILAFLMVLAAAVLTVDSMFLFAFGAFMLIAVATFILMEMRRSAQAADVQAASGQAATGDDTAQSRQMVLSLSRVAPALMVMILAGAAALFFILPRGSAGYLGSYAFGTDFSSGFSDHVQLGRIGQIQLSNEVVMHVQIDGDHSGHYDLHWRGVALSDFDGHTWSKPQRTMVLQPLPDGSYTIPQTESVGNASYLPPNRSHSLILHYRVLMEPIGTNIFFLAPWAQRVSGDYSLLTTDPAGAVYNNDTQHASIRRYEAFSDVGRPTPNELRQATQDYPAEISADYLQLPPLDDRIGALAAQVTQTAGNNFDKAAALENYLRTRYGYTLQMPQVSQRDPIANFLFTRKQGHCEYFASSMAVMLRTLGIPSRVVNGFRSDEFNDVTGNYVIRAKDAHAWVEAYFPGYGWQTFDPTPGGGANTPQGWGRVALYFDAMTSFWREWIVSYDSTHQYVLGQTAAKQTRGLWMSARIWAHARYNAMLKWAKRSQRRVEQSPGRWMVFGVMAAGVLLLLANMGRVVRAVREHWLRTRSSRSPEQAAALWYQRMARTVARRGVEKSAAQTPREFVQRIEDLRLREPVARFTDVYESARFGNSPEDARRLPELYEEVELATKE